MDKTLLITREIDAAIAGTLYRSVKPIGVGTSQTESLGSYMHRLAQAHCVEAVEIVRYLLSANEKKHFKNGESFYAQGINGHQGRVPLLPILTQLLSTGTGRTDLQALSLINWTDILSLNHVHRRYMAWCPKCIEERIEHEEAIFEPLVWTFNAISHCIIHRTALVSSCGVCGHRPCYFEPRIVLGYCSRCYAPLSASKLDERDFDADDKGIVQPILDLILSTVEMECRPERTCIPEAVGLYREIYCKGNGAELARRIGVGQTVLLDEYLNTHLLSIPLSIQLAKFFGVSISRLLNNRYLSEVLSLLKTNLQVESKKVITSRKINWSKESVENRLRAFLEVIPPLSFTQVASNLGYTRRRLNLHFPDLCKLITGRYRDYCVEQKGYYPGQHLNQPDSSEKQTQLREELVKLVESLDPPERLAIIAVRLGKDIYFLKRNFPDICYQIKEKYGTYVKENRVIKGKMRTYTLRELESIVDNKIKNEELVQSSNQISRELGLRQRVLKELFPAQYSLIITRFNAKKSLMAEAEKENKVQQIREAVLALNDMGLYPSTTKVCEILGFNPYTNMVLHDVWRVMLNQLGYQTEI